MRPYLIFVTFIKYKICRDKFICGEISDFDECGVISIFSHDSCREIWNFSTSGVDNVSTHVQFMLLCSLIGYVAIYAVLHAICFVLICALLCGEKFNQKLHICGEKMTNISYVWGYSTFLPVLDTVLWTRVLANKSQKIFPASKYSKKFWNHYLLEPQTGVECPWWFWRHQE